MDNGQGEIAMFFDIIKFVAAIFLIYVGFIVFSAVLSLLIKIALLLFLAAGIYYLYHRATHRGWRRMFFKRDR
ncbi:MAG: hypothetical protein ACYCVB_08695 [Bacilli bacterium]